MSLFSEDDDQRVVIDLDAKVAEDKAGGEAATEAAVKAAADEAAATAAAAALPKTGEADKKAEEDAAAAKAAADAEAAKTGAEDEAAKLKAEAEEADEATKAGLKKIPKPTEDPVQKTEADKKVEETAWATAAAERLSKIEGDPFLKKFIEYRLAGGDPQAYLESQAKDWTKESDFKVIRDEFFASDKVAGLDSEAAEELFSREISDKYSAGIDGSYEDENSKLARVGKQFMKRDAEKLRTSHIEQQQKFAIPKAEEKPVVQYDPVKERENILKNESVKTFVADKLIGIADTGYAHEVEDPEAIIGMMTDQRNFWALFKKEDGTVDFGKLTKAFAFAKNPSKYENDILALGKALGEEGYLKEKKNIGKKKEENQDHSVDSKTFDKTGFLKAMAAQNPKSGG